MALRFARDPARPDLVTVAVEGLPATALDELARRRPARAEWRRLLAVIASEDGQIDDLPPVLGDWSIQDGVLRFRPRFPPAPGITLTARFDGGVFDRLAGATGTPSRERVFTVPELDRRPSTRVVAVHPSARELPENLLRFYVYFSAPMSAREVLPHVALLDADGAPVPVAFVEVEGGLWDPERTRLTLLLHPGRVKRGIGPRQALGPVLEAGRRYTLRVGAAARDVDGLPLVRGFEHGFVAGPPDHEPPAPDRWRLDPPKTPDAPLALALEAPADRALLARLLRVVDASGAPVAGTVRVDAGETRWRFTPAEPWRPGRYALVVPRELEDPAGNRIGRRFEALPAPRERLAEPVRLPFRVPPS